MIIEILRNAEPTRKSVLTNKHSCTPSQKLQSKATILNKRLQKDYQLGSAGQVCQVFVKELSLQFRNFLNQTRDLPQLLKFRSIVLHCLEGITNFKLTMD